ncbi:Maf family protein [Sphingorhabdus arenilitoris]|uniref:Nucleoside triphosphate pyrophosphatase n=1 Tax=Sphingorhabdus arenilitoris TaxID=1490041 RepID=A0ABV8RD92_9SPHN
MNQVIAKDLILASKSAARLAMLESVGLKLDGVAPMVDEDAIKEAMIAENATPRVMSDALAEAKAVKISKKYPGALVLGSDQILEGPDGATMSKAESPDEAKEKLAALSGKTHRLYSAAVIAEGGRPSWRHIEKAVLTMRALSARFIDEYVDQYWEEIRPCVGCYRIEAEGLQLFQKVEGDHHAIMGMPLLAILDYLRIRGNLPS